MPKSLLNTYADKTDNQLIRLVKNVSDGEAFEEICRRYENVFYKVCQKYSNSLSYAGIHTQDIFDEKTFIIYHCVKTFNQKKKTKLSTWIGNYARYLCLNSINSRKFILPNSDDESLSNLEATQVTQNYLAKGYTAEDYDYILNIIGQLKDKRVPQIFKYRYFSHPKKMKWARIAKKMNISTQTAINLHNKGILMLRKKVKSQNISDIV
jgi:RNA polymerase sigma factor (sigma-70 family)